MKGKNPQKGKKKRRKAVAGEKCPDWADPLSVFCIGMGAHSLDSPRPMRKMGIVGQASLQLATKCALVATVAEPRVYDLQVLGRAGEVWHACMFGVKDTTMYAMVIMGEVSTRRRWVAMVRE